MMKSLNNCNNTARKTMMLLLKLNSDWYAGPMGEPEGSFVS